MLSKTILALAAASLIQDVVALSPRHHAHQQLHEKRAIVTELVTETAWVTVTLGEQEPTAAVAAAAFTPKKFYTNSRKRFSRTAKSSTTVLPSDTPVAEAVPTTLVSQIKESAESAAPTIEAIPGPPINNPPDVAPPAQPSPVVPAPPAPPAPANPAPIDTAPAAPSPPKGGAPGGARGRGLAYNDPGLLPRFLGSGTKISWTYNWGQTDDSKTGLSFVPMLWGTTKGFPATWAANAQRMIDAGSKYLFSFNEPDNLGQANMSPEDAARAHIQYMNPFAGKAQIGAPAITNSGQPNEGTRWLARWFTACGGQCACDFVNIHIYGFDTTTFLRHLIDVNKQFNLPVWITEFAFDGSDDEINRQLGVVIDQIENNATYSFVHNWSYFMASDGRMVKGNSMSSYGNAFAYS
jgi:hypothetical protein